MEDNSRRNVLSVIYYLINSGHLLDSGVGDSDLEAAGLTIDSYRRAALM